MPCAKELYQQPNQLPPLEKLHLAELLLADLDPRSGNRYHLAK